LLMNLVINMKSIPLHNVLNKSTHNNQAGKPAQTMR
jgi:hypothetical protein